MIFNVTGGGGTALNFKVIGGTSAPPNPTNNTIWVNTDATITSYVFSPTTPTSPTAGMVWIVTLDSGSVSLNTLKKNNITVYPSTCYQYISSAWTVKTAKIYQGSWKPLDFLVDLNTGNWTILPAATYGHAFTYADGVLTFAASKGATNSWVSAGRYCNEKVNLSNYNTMTIDLVVTHSGAGNIKFGVTNNVNIGDLGAGQASVTLSGNFTGTKTIDVSALSGEHYVAMNIYLGDNFSCTAKINSIKFE